MTATVAALGLVPFLFATGPGSEIQRPLAIVVIGGLLSSTLLTLVLVPVVYAYFSGERSSKTSDRNSDVGGSEIGEPQLRPELEMH